LFKEPLRCDDHVLPVAVSIGLCRLQDDVAPGVTVLRHANIALNRAKLNLRAYYEYFVPEMEDSPRQRLNIIGDLRQAFETNGLSVWFQPQIVMQTSALWGMEALIRWPNGPDKFVQPPNVFIPLAEYSGLIVDIGFWVLEQACALFVKMRSLPDAPPRVAVNASMVQFRSPNFAARVAAILKRYEVRAEELELEITENLAMDDPKRVLAMLAELKRLGVTIALDDFGTGYSSLSHLDRMPIDCLKIDQSFVAEIGNGHGEELAETIVALGRKLRLTTIAEGVETSEQAKYLRDIGCNVAQGYLFAKPMPPDALYDWLRHRPKFGDTA
jgi:EAL domain-containing protein (putative c-di-GMP-specific phosphodiesterase class I)